MNGLTCDQVDLLLELYNTGACGHEESRAVEDHLASCPSCSASLARVRQVVGLLDLHFQMPDRLARLQERLRREPVVHRHPGRVAVRRFMALAALLLVTLGLGSLLMPGRQVDSSGLYLLASLDMPDMKREMAKPAVLMGNHAAFVARKLTDLDVKLSLSNTSERPIRLDLDHGVLQFTLTDPDGHIVRGALKPKLPAGRQENVVLEPGGRFELAINGFAEPGSQGVLSRPGEYTLSIRYIAQWSEPGNGPVQKRTLEAPPLKFSVWPAP
jgi:Putative zinc-finger